MTSSRQNARSGNAGPRVSRYPSYPTSAGDEAIDLAASAGLILDPWQQDILRHGLGEQPDGRWSAFEVGVIVSRQNGKGALLEARELAGLLLFGERLILHSAHEMKTAIEAFRRIQDLFTNSDDLRRRVARVTIQRGDEGIELRNGARLRFVARSKGSGRGFSGDCVILDEAYAVTAAQVDALLPTLSARPNPQVWYTSSPPLDGDTGEQLFALRDRAFARADDLAYFDFGADGCLSKLEQINLDDRDLWAATNPAYGIRISERFVAAERRALTAAGFARERLGVWPKRAAVGGVVLDPDRWARMCDPESRRVGGGLALAVDVTPLRDAATIGLYGPAGFGTEHMRIVDHRPGTGWVAGRLAELRDVLNPLVVALDAKNGAAALIPELEQRGFRLPEDPEHPEHGDLLVTNAAQMADAVGQFIDGFRRDPAAFRHHGQEPLDSAVRNARARPIGDAGAIAWGRKASEVDIGPLITVTLARYAYLQRTNVKDKTVVLTGSLMA